MSQDIIMGRNKIVQCADCGRHMRSHHLKQHTHVHANAITLGLSEDQRMWESHDMKIEGSSNMKCITSQAQQITPLSKAMIKLHQSEMKDDASQQIDNNQKSKLKNDNADVRNIRRSRRSAAFISDNAFNRNLVNDIKSAQEWSDLAINHIYKLEEFIWKNERITARMRTANDDEIIVFLPKPVIDRLLSIQEEKNIKIWIRRNTEEKFDIATSVKLICPKCSKEFTYPKWLNKHVNQCCI